MDWWVLVLILSFSVHVSWNHGINDPMSWYGNMETSLVQTAGDNELSYNENGYPYLKDDVGPKVEKESRDIGISE